MTQPSVDIELQDMADGVGTSLRTLMAGVLNGRFSEFVSEEDLVRGDKGDPLFFRIDQSRAYSIFGSDVATVAKDMSTVEEMSTTEDTRGEETRENGFSVSEGEMQDIASTEDGHSTTRENASDSGFTVGQFAVLAGGIGLLGWALSSQSQSLTEEQRQQVYADGYRGYFEGVRRNPYDPETEAGKLYQEGWDEARRRVALNPPQIARIA